MTHSRAFCRISPRPLEPIAALFPIALLVATLSLVPLSAVHAQQANAPAQPQSESLWQQTRDGASNLWSSTSETADELIEQGSEWVPWPWGEENASNKGEPLFIRVEDTLDRALVLQDAHDSLPRNAWLSRDQHDNQEDINALLDQAIGILSDSPLPDYRKRIADLERKIAAARRKIDDLRRERIGAPSESLVKRTTADIDEDIAEERRDIERFKAEIEGVEQELAEELRGLGLSVSEEQLAVLLSTVIGDEMVDLSLVLDQVEDLTVQLEQLVEDSGEDLEAARRYYGMYVVLLKSLERMHRNIEQAIRDRYVPQIDAIIERAKVLQRQTRRLIDRAPDKAKVLRANLEAQRLTIEAAQVYRRYLKEQRAQIEKARIALKQDIATAWITYETVRVSGELVSLVKSSRQLLVSLRERDLPALRPFKNAEMKREFEKLTDELRRSGAGSR